MKRNLRKVFFMVIFGGSAPTMAADQVFSPIAEIAPSFSPATPDLTQGGPLAMGGNASQLSEPALTKAGNASQLSEPALPMGGNTSQLSEPALPMGGNTSQLSEPALAMGGNASQISEPALAMGGNASQISEPSLTMTGNPTEASDASAPEIEMAALQNPQIVPTKAPSSVLSSAHEAFSEEKKSMGPSETAYNISMLLAPLIIPPLQKSVEESVEKSVRKSIKASLIEASQATSPSAYEASSPREYSSFRTEEPKDIGSDMNIEASNSSSSPLENVGSSLHSK
jgi:hypothetical protein